MLQSLVIFSYMCNWCVGATKIEFCNSMKSGSKIIYCQEITKIQIHKIDTTYVLRLKYRNSRPGLKKKNHGIILFKVGLCQFNMEKLSFHFNPKEEQCQRVFNIPHISHFSKVMLKIFKRGFNSLWTKNFKMKKLDVENAEEPEIKLPTPTGS